MTAEYPERITVNEQSSIRWETREAVLRFDPFHVEGTPHDADVIFITHPHFDHFSPEDIAKVSKADTVYVIPSSMSGDADKAGIPADRRTELKAGETVSVRGAAVEAIPAYNKLKPFHPKLKGWLGYAVTADGVRVYAAGDTDDTREARQVRCDIALLPIGGTYTTDAAAAAALCGALAPQCVIPIHYGTVVGTPDAYEKFAGSVKIARVIRKL